MVPFTFPRPWVWELLQFIINGFLDVVQVWLVRWIQISRWGRQHQEEGACMKISLPIFKDEDAKDAVTYQSWRWDLTVYWCAGCRDHTLLPYVIRSLQGYPTELVWSSGMDIALEDVLTILDEHYTMWKHVMCWTRSYSNCRLWIRKQCQTGAFAFQGIFRF